MNDSQEKLVEDWFRRARESQAVHYASASHFSWLNLILGIPTIIITTIVGTAVFASMDNQDIGEYKVLLGLISILASVLAALHTFLGYAQRSEKHRATGAIYGSIRRELELIKTCSIADVDICSEKLGQVKSRMDTLAENSPEVPKKIWVKEMKDLKGRDHNRIFNIKKQNK